ncbi:unnamed protein product, partial [Polarella glacialis]
VTVTLITVSRSWLRRRSGGMGQSSRGWLRSWEDASGPPSVVVVGVVVGVVVVAVVVAVVVVVV